MKEKKLPEGCIDNKVSASDGSFSLPDKPTKLNEDDLEGSLEKQFSFNRGSFSAPVDEFNKEPEVEDEEAEDQLEDMEEKARFGEKREGK